MKDVLRVMLFDVDGVIVDPLAYREGLNQTVALLCRRCRFENWQELLATEDEVARMEAIGVHDVWDITDIVFAAILTNVALQLLERGIAVEFNQRLEGLTAQQCLDEIGTLTLSVTRPDYGKLIQALSSSSPEGKSHPPDDARELLTAALRHASPDALVDQWVRLLDLFLVGTRTPYQSYGTRLFQNIVLGGEDFTSTYELPSEYDGQSLLKTFDRPMIAPANVEALKQMKCAGECLAVYTARPSLSCGKRAIGYSPEAEIALTVAGLEDTLPLVGMGAMDWLAEKHSERSEDLTKPNTTQALAALLAALAGRCDEDILEEAYRLTRSFADGDGTESNWSEIAPTLATLSEKETVVIVFEDTVSGIKPMLALEERFRRFGLSLSVRPLGIAKNVDKRRSLATVCGEALFNDTNEAINSVLSLAN